MGTQFEGRRVRGKTQIFYKLDIPIACENAEIIKYVRTEKEFNLFFRARGIEGV